MGQPCAFDAKHGDSVASMNGVPYCGACSLAVQRIVGPIIHDLTHAVSGLIGPEKP